MYVCVLLVGPVQLGEGTGGGGGGAKGARRRRGRDKGANRGTGKDGDAVDKEVLRFSPLANEAFEQVWVGGWVGVRVCVCVVPRSITGASAPLRATTRPPLAV
jgi:hypothetical protein